MQPILRLNFLLFASSLLMIICITVIVYTRVEIQHDSNCFTAGVLDHVKRKYTEDDNNFLLFVEATRIAKQNEVDLIVFPEGGLSTPKTKIFAKTREETRYQLSKVIDIIPNNKTKLCLEDDKKKLEDIILSPKEKILTRLACLAKLYKIYVSAQLMDHQPCNPINDIKCPSDLFYLFNTAILFDRDGQLIGKYHKMQPFGEMTINPAPNPELISIDTELGRLGFQICFDIIYEQPGHDLSYNNKVDTMIFPTHWMNELPYLSASQYQLAWALGNQVNLLGSNMHNPLTGSVGSGVYNGFDGHFMNSNFANDSKASRLVISRIPKYPKKTERSKCSNKNDKIIEVNLNSDDQLLENDVSESATQYRYKRMDSSLIEFKQLIDNENNDLELKSESITCKLSYQADFNSLPADTGYFLLASKRQRPNPSYRWAEEFCLLSYCKVEGGKCTDYITIDKPIFNWVKMDASFTNETTVYPSAVEYQHKPIELTEWNYNIDFTQKTGNHSIEFGNKQEDKSNYQFKKLSILYLYGRLYKEDPPYKQVPPHDGPIN